MPVGTHQMSNTRLYWIWGSMIQRCNNEKCTAYPNYGGRGIKVCDEWISSENFINWAICNGYEPGLQIDRKDNDGPYSPDNCEFVTRTKNLSHTRHNVFVSAFGETKHLKDWSRDERCKCKYRVLVKRICNRNWPAEKAICTPERTSKTIAAFGEEKTLKEWSLDDRCKCSLAALARRIKKQQDTIESLEAPMRAPKTFVAFGEEKTLKEWGSDARCKCSQQLLSQRVSSRKWDIERALSTPVKKN